MAGFAFMHDSDEFSGGVGAEMEEGAEGLRAEVGLITKSDDQMAERRVLLGPARRGDDGAHHAALKGEGGRALASQDAKPVEFPDNGSILLRRMDHEDLLRPRFAPLGKEMTKDGGLFPRQAELGRTHPAGFPGGEDGEEGGHGRRGEGREA